MLSLSRLLLLINNDHRLNFVYLNAWCFSIGMYCYWGHAPISFEFPGVWVEVFLSSKRLNQSVCYLGTPSDPLGPFSWSLGCGISGSEQLHVSNRKQDKRAEVTLLGICVCPASFIQVCLMLKKAKLNRIGSPCIRIPDSMLTLSVLFWKRTILD